MPDSITWSIPPIDDSLNHLNHSSILEMLESMPTQLSSVGIPSSYFKKSKKIDKNEKMNNYILINEKLDLNKCYNEVPSIFTNIDDIKEWKNKTYNIKGKEYSFEQVVIVRELGSFPKNDPSLYIDYFDNNTVVHTDYSVKFYINYDIKTDSFKSYGLTHPETLYTGNVITIVNSLGEEHVCSYEVIEEPDFKLKYREYLLNGRFYHISIDIDNTLHLKIHGINIETSVFNWLKSVKNKPMTYINTYGKKYPFGIEIETISGLMPKHTTKNLYFSSVHDGSLRHQDDGKTYGKEYVTNILQGDLGLLQLKMLTQELRKRCLINHQCGIHTHLSDITFNQEAIVLMYYTYLNIQDEIFQLLPKSRRNNEYCRRLDPIAINIDNIESNRDYYIQYYYDLIVYKLSQKDISGKFVNKKKDHPKGFKCGYDHSAGRYCWVNFIPAIFNTRDNEVYTIEFRPMSATLSYVKIKNWLLICMALVDIVENHKLFIYNNKKFNLTTILDQVYGRNSNELINWVDKRKEKFETNVFKNSTERIIFEQSEYDECEISDSKSLKKL